VFNFLSNILGSTGTRITKFISGVGASGAGAAHFVVTNILIIGSVSGVVALGTAGTIAGTYRNASNLHAGIIPDARLSSNIAKYDDLAPTFAHGLTAASFTGNLVGNASTATALAASPTGCIAGSFANSIDSGANLLCSNDGSQLVNLNASNLSSGTVSDARLSSNIPRLDALSNIFKGSITAASFNGNFTGNIIGNATNFTGSLSGDVTGTQSATVVSHVSDSALSSNVAKYNDPSPTFTNGLTAASFAGDLTGNVTGNLTGNVTGNIDSSGGTLTLGGTNASDISLGSSGNPIDTTVWGSNIFFNGIDLQSDGFGDLYYNDFATDGSNVYADNFYSYNGLFDTVNSGDTLYVGTDNAGHIYVASSGVTTEVQGDLTVDGSTSISGGAVDNVAITNSTIDSTVTGNGSGLTSLTGANVTGTVANATTAVNFSGSLSGDVTGTQGSTVVSHVSDGAFSSNVPLKNALSNIFTGSITATSFSGDLTGNVTGNLTGNVTGNVSGNAGTATTLQTPRNINGVSFNGSADITITAAAGTLTGTTLNPTVVTSSLTSVGTLANLTVTNPISGSVTGSSGSTTGNAATATALQNPRTINGVSFDGTSNITITADAGTLTGTVLNATVTDSSLTSVGTLANLTVTNPISGSVTGSSGSTTGNAATATKLQTARNINGVAFDGTGDITVTADSSTLTGTVLNATVVSSSLTSVGTLANLTVTNPIVGSVTGSSGSTTGNAATATALQNPRTINGVSFDGTSNITITVDANNLTGTTLNSSVVTSSLTSVGTLSNLTSNGAINFTSATSLTVPVISTALTSGVTVCSPDGSFVYTTNNHRFFGCEAGLWVQAF